MGHPWDDLETDLPQPGEVSDHQCGIADTFGTDCDNPPVDEVDDEPDELNEYDEADDEFEDDEEDES